MQSSGLANVIKDVLRAVTSSLQVPTIIILILFMGGVLITLIGVAYCIYSYFELHRHVRHMENGDFEPTEHPVKLGGDFASFVQGALPGVMIGLSALALIMRPR